MLEPERAEFAQHLLEKAEGDLRALEVLAADPDQADHVLGLLAQQAVEKATKAVLVAHGERNPRTHELASLFEIASKVGIAVPEEVSPADRLSTWAGAIRYEAIDAPLDRDQALSAARAALTWAQQELQRHS